MGSCADLVLAPRAAPEPSVSIRETALLGIGSMLDAAVHALFPELAPSRWRPPGIPVLLAATTTTKSRR